MDRSVVLVTGAGRGIGAAVARRMADNGWAVVAVDVCSDDTTLRYPLAGREELERVVEACGPHAVAVEADVRDQDALDAAVDLAVTRFGGLDACVACAGVLWGGSPTWLTPDAAWQALMDVNVGGVWRLARAAMPALLARREPRMGRFVAVSSAAGLQGLPQLAAYSASKHAVLGLVRSMALELGDSGITVNAVAPGSTDTMLLEASAEIYGLESSEAFAGQQPIGRILRPEEVAAMIVWLCSPASSGVTGAVFPVDGGFHAA